MCYNAIAYTRKDHGKKEEEEEEEEDDVVEDIYKQS